MILSMKMVLLVYSCLLIIFIKHLRQYRRYGDIPVMSSSDELSELLMSLMPYEPAIYKKLYNVVWDYIKGNDVMFPIKLL